MAKPKKTISSKKYAEPYKKKNIKANVRSGEKSNELSENHTDTNIIVRTDGICSFNDFLKGLDEDGTKLFNKARQFDEKIGSCYYNYHFQDIVLRVWWFDYETGKLTAKHLAYIVYHYLLDIPVYTSEQWKPRTDGGTGKNELFEIWGNNGSKNGVILNQFSLKEFMDEEENAMEQQARYAMQKSMPYQYDEPINGDDFELVHQVQFFSFSQRLMKLKEAFAQVVSKGDPKSLTSISKALSSIMEQSYQSDFCDTDNTLEIIEKSGGKIKELDDTQKRDFSDFLNTFTSSLLPTI